MNEAITQPLLLRLAVTCAFTAGAWIGIVKPARAAYDFRTEQLRAQQSEVEGVNARADDTTEATIARIDRVTQRMQTSLRLNQSAAEAIASFERTAADHAVRIRRTEPRGSDQARGNDKAATPLFVDRYFLELTGAYADIADYLSDLRENAGMLNVDAFRLSASPQGQVTAAVDITVFHIPTNAAFFGQATEVNSAP